MFQGVFHGDIAVEFFVVVLRCVAIIVDGDVGDYFFGCEQAFVDAEAIEQGFEGAAGLADGGSAIDLSAVGGVGEAGGADVGDDLLGGIVFDDDGGVADVLEVEGLYVAADELLYFALCVEPDVGLYGGLAGAFEFASEVWNVLGHALTGGGEGFAEGVLNFFLGEYVAGGKALEPFVAFVDDEVVVFTNDEGGGPVGDDGEGGDFCQGKVVGVFLKVKDGCSFDALDVASVGQFIEVELQDFVFTVFPFQLESSEHFDEFVEIGSSFGFESSCDLHGDGGGS